MLDARDAREWDRMPPRPPDEYGPPPGSAEEWELLMERDELLDRYDGRPEDMVEVADDPFAGLDLDSAYAELEEIER